MGCHSPRGIQIARGEIECSKRVEGKCDVECIGFGIRLFVIHVYSYINISLIKSEISLYAEDFDRFIF